jgi:hypothetical protein
VAPVENRPNFSRKPHLDELDPLALHGLWTYVNASPKGVCTKRLSLEPPLEQRVKNLTIREKGVPIR